jgi:DNA-binding LacI/PurR family transcriptional regulator/two-component sensor histidine kinase
MEQEKRCIGIFTASLDDGYQSTVWHAIERVAKDRGYGTISFLGSRLGSPIASEASSNLAYHLANDQNIDGLIIISSSLATFFSSVDLKDFFARWATLPRVSIGMKIPGMSDVVVEGSGGVSQLVEHLINEHGRRHFAMIGGPESHDEAIARLQSCKATLRTHGIPMDERLVKTGTFTQDSGTRAVKELLETGIPFDALVCMNDRMAQGALDELARCAINVPDDVSLIGFDGIESSRYTTPPLTTVVQPMHELGERAVEILDRMMQGGAEEHMILSCEPVIRESCGCAPRFSYTPDLEEIPRYATTSERQAIFDLMVLVRKGAYEKVIMRLNRAIDATSAESGALDRWNDYLSVIENHCAKTEPRSRQLSTIMGAARALTGEKFGRLQAAKRISVETSFETLRQVSAMLAGAFELKDMFHNLRKSLGLFGIRKGYLVVFNGKQGKAQLLMNIQDRESPSVEFDYNELLPRHIPEEWREGQWILMPLVHVDEPLGYLLVPIGTVIPALYDVLQEQISSSLKGTLLLEQVRSHERTLAEQVELRTKDLIRTNRDLSSEIKRRLELEHEVMEISSKTMERIGQDLHDDLCQHLLGISLLATSVKKTVTDNHPVRPETLEQISRLLTESIAKIKTISRGLLPLEMESHTFAEKLEALVGDTKRYARVQVDLEADPQFEIEDPDRSLHMFRIIQEALTNAVKHAKAKRVEITLKFETDREGNSIRVATIRDDGVGLPAKIREGGLGLRIMRNRASMAQVELDIKSSPEGTTVRVIAGRSEHESID